MILIEYVKALGFVMALIFALRKWQHTPSWMRIGTLAVGQAELVMGYFAGTLAGSLIFWPNMTTYAIWFYYGLSIAIVATYRMMRSETGSDLSVWSFDVLLVVELVVILAHDELLWEWEWGHIIAGIACCMLFAGLFVGLKHVCGGKSADDCS